MRGIYQQLVASILMQIAAIFIGASILMQNAVISRFASILMQIAVISSIAWILMQIGKFLILLNEFYLKILW